MIVPITNCFCVSLVKATTAPYPASTFWVWPSCRRRSTRTRRRMVSWRRGRPGSRGGWSARRARARRRGRRRARGGRRGRTGRTTRWRMRTSCMGRRARTTRTGIIRCRRSGQRAADAAGPRKTWTIRRMRMIWLIIRVSQKSRHLSHSVFWSDTCTK